MESGFRSNRTKSDTSVSSLNSTTIEGRLENGKPTFTPYDITNNGHLRTSENWVQPTGVPSEKSLASVPSDFCLVDYLKKNNASVDNRSVISVRSNDYSKERKPASSKNGRSHYSEKVVQIEYPPTNLQYHPTSTAIQYPASAGVLRSDDGAIYFTPSSNYPPEVLQDLYQKSLFMANQGAFGRQVPQIYSNAIQPFYQNFAAPFGVPPSTAPTFGASKSTSLAPSKLQPHKQMIGDGLISNTAFNPPLNMSTVSQQSAYYNNPTYVQNESNLTNYVYDIYDRIPLENRQPMVAATPEPIWYPLAIHYTSAE